MPLKRVNNAGNPIRARRSSLCNGALRLKKCKPCATTANVDRRALCNEIIFEVRPDLNASKLDERDSIDMFCCLDGSHKSLILFPLFIVCPY